MFLATEVEDVVNALPVAVVITNPERDIISANQMALELFHYEEAELVGQKIEVLLPERFSQSHPVLFEDFRHHPVSRCMGRGRELFGRRRDGSEFHCEIGLMVLSTEPAFYVAVVVDLSIHKDRETRLRERQDLLEATLEEARTQLEHHVAASTRKQERDLLGRELHDSVSQSLYGIGLGLQTIKARLAKHTDPTEAVDYCLELTESSLLEMRAILYDLRPQTLEGLPLADVLECHVGALRKRVPFRLTFTHQKESSKRLDYDRKYALYRIATEALHNCHKHAQGATLVEVRLSNQEDRAILSVTDDGPGFAQPSGQGLGLQTMQERVEGCGGTFTITSGSGGTTIVASVPREGGPT